MAKAESYLKRWREAGLLEAAAAERIRAWERERPRHAARRWQVLAAVGLGSILLVAGAISYLAARWDWMSPWGQFWLLAALVAAFHAAGAWARPRLEWMGTVLGLAGTLACGIVILIASTLFHLAGHGPGALMLCALAALAGWALLRDQAQQILALLLVALWLVTEAADAGFGYNGGAVFTGRLIAVLSVLYITFFLQSGRRAVQAVLFAAGAMGGVLGTALMLEGWGAAGPGLLPLGARTWLWALIVVAPLSVAIFHPRRSFVPVVTAIVYAWAMPWCAHAFRISYNNGLNRGAYTQSEPALAAYALAAAMAAFLTFWGVRIASGALVNLGIAWFALAVGWFLYSNLFDTVGRSLGLIALGVMFLVGGWALERTRRGLIARIGQHGAATQDRSGAAPEPVPAAGKEPVP